MQSIDAAADVSVRKRRNRVPYAVAVVIGTLLLTGSAKVQVPFWPVPLTLQTFATVMLAFMVGWRLAGATVLAYLAEGALGLPVFAGTPGKGVGIAYMTGPTGGYLVGLLFAAVLVGFLADRGAGRRLGSTIATLLAGVVLIYVPGVLWLALYIGLGPAVQAGAAPFLLAEAVKLGLATALLRAAARRTSAYGVGRSRGG